MLNTLQNRRFHLGLLLFAVVLSVPLQLQAQEYEAPQIGVQPARSYHLSGIDTIEKQSRNLLINLPALSLPAGRGGAPGPTVSILYNSSLWRTSYQQFWRETWCRSEPGCRLPLRV